MYGCGLRQLCKTCAPSFCYTKNKPPNSNLKVGVWKCEKNGLQLPTPNVVKQIEHAIGTDNGNI